MNALQQWAVDWGVPQRALDDLAARLAPPLPDTRAAEKSEAWVQSQVRLEAARSGSMLLFRNNVGAGKLANGSFIRWGLANDSARVNDLYKSADLIGIERRVIHDCDVGHTVGVFKSIECKALGKDPTKSAEWAAQERWMLMVLAWGGSAVVINGAGQLK